MDTQAGQELARKLGDRIDDELKLNHLTRLNAAMHHGIPYTEPDRLVVRHEHVDARAPDTTKNKPEKRSDPQPQQPPPPPPIQKVVVEHAPLKVEPVQVRSEPVQVRSEPVQVRSEPVQVRSDPVQVRVEGDSAASTLPGRWNQFLSWLPPWAWSLLFLTAGIVGGGGAVAAWNAYVTPPTEETRSDSLLQYLEDQGFHVPPSERP